MEAREEMLDLRINPLPVSEIKNPLSYVWELDGQIATITETLNDLNRLRAETLEYAVKQGIKEDERCRITEKAQVTRALDVARFREVFPQEYAEICEDIRRDLQREIEAVGAKIPLTKIDAKIKKVVLEGAPGVIKKTATFTYGVERK